MLPRLALSGEGTAVGIGALILCPVPIVGWLFARFVRKVYGPETNAHTCAEIVGILNGLWSMIFVCMVLVLIVAGIGLGIIKPSDKFNFEINKKEFQKVADLITLKQGSPSFSDYVYPPPRSLSQIGINGEIDNKDGSIVFSYGLQYFDGPTRVLIYDPKNVYNHNYEKEIRGKKPLAMWTIGAWTYIKNDD